MYVLIMFVLDFIYIYKIINKEKIKENMVLRKSDKKKLTSKYGLHAERTTLWAFRYFPSAANVQSTSVPLS